MFSIEFLDQIRSYELSFYKSFLSSGSKVLEIGGGTGIQAKQLSDLGFKVSSVDIAGSNYADNRVFPIIDYDGKNLPFEAASFNIIFSSNALEHIKDIDNLHDEFRRVLIKNGYSVHIMPSSTWRLWTIIAHYIELLQRIVSYMPKLLPLEISIHELIRIAYQVIEILRTIKYYFIPPRHGEFGNCITELYTFSRSYWSKHFKNNNYVLVDVVPMRLFYTGHMIMGKMLSLKNREKLSLILGSSCILYRVKNK